MLNSDARVLVTGATGFIGSRLTAHLRDRGHTVLGIDRRPGESTELCDIRDTEALSGIFGRYEPTHVVNLAGETTLDLPMLADYSTNIGGTRNIVEACDESRSVCRLVHTSTQHVHRRSEPPRTSWDFNPDTLYAQSKVLSELIVRQLRGTEWVIARPTNVWGPRHPHLASGFWRQLVLGRYIHPRGAPVIRGYSYVENAVQQLVRLLEHPEAHGRVVYVTDEPICQDIWVDSFALALTGRKARRAPLPVVAAIAAGGEVLRRAGLPAPLYWSRFQSMTMSQRVPYNETYELVGPSRVTLEQGVHETARWLEGLWCTGADRTPLGRHPST